MAIGNWDQNESWEHRNPKQTRLKMHFILRAEWFTERQKSLIYKNFRIPKFPVRTNWGHQPFQKNNVKESHRSQTWLFPVRFESLFIPLNNLSLASLMLAKTKNLPCRNAEISVYDLLAKTMYDAKRDCKYAPEKRELWDDIGELQFAVYRLAAIYWHTRKKRIIIYKN